MDFGDKLGRKLKFSITEAPVKLKPTDQNTNFFAAADKVDLQISNHLETIQKLGIVQSQGTPETSHQRLAAAGSRAPVLGAVEWLWT